ncbi:sugar lactone lactonase YvrE [Paenibacillus cellulosilyticus]|uniref:Regucalcin n=1 Tax=Paenibacillus cellulosilyticus TaxID=375489 RepID=A0A2V2YSB9_9BACL|nr:SMP-30/gluconolactonase/LRE family protein [Paenibacillus cellulosilyticus]PWW00989.1 sugar lactone lactonase YvrE [Paenibacillus cellulosilyticus]QKS47629.1 SMP-30/gluconolactonase/LRE family protein [Paenibacillus cellulosilyticus]
MYEVSLVYDAHAALGEGPVWDPINARLYWVDILANKIHIYDPNQPHLSSYIEVGPYVSSVIPRRSGGLVVTLQDGFYAFDPESAELTLLAKVESPELGNRFNDGKCDPSGRYLAGTMSLNDVVGNGKLYCLDLDHTVKPLVSEVTISNGLAWTSDGTTLYFIDTPTQQVVAYDYELTTGALSNRRVAITIPDEEGYPDGMTIDSEGMLWIAHWGGWQVARWNPITGDKLLSIPIPASQVTSCTFGGPELDELYITTASVGLDAEKLATQPHAGGLFRVKVGVTGLPFEPFRG